MFPCQEHIINFSAYDFGKWAYQQEHGTRKITAHCPDLLAIDDRALTTVGCVATVSVHIEGVDNSSGVRLCCVVLAVAPRPTG